MIRENQLPIHPKSVEIYSGTVASRGFPASWFTRGCALVWPGRDLKNKKVTRGSHRNNVSPLTQGLAWTTVQPMENVKPILKVFFPQLLSRLTFQRKLSVSDVSDSNSS